MKLSFPKIFGVIIVFAVGASAIPAVTRRQNARTHRRHQGIASRKSAPIIPRDSRAGVISASGGQCGDPNATNSPSQTGGPNGDEMWLDCGVNTTSGWTPPPVTLDNIIYEDLSDVMSQPNNPFEPCQPYLSMFQELSGDTGIPTILLASISLQESGCQPNVTGGAGEIGMMQVTSDKCPAGNITQCYDPYTNIGIGARYLGTVLDENNGNLAAAMGNYNGWWAGMTEFDANNYPECARHNNLDYLQNVFNGFLQGVNPYDTGMGIFHNTCPN